MDQAPQELPPGLRLLKGLVTVLTVAMIAGVIAVVWLLVTQLPRAMRAGPELPETISLPDGATAQAITFGQGFVAVVTDDRRILIFAPDGTLRQEVAITD
ncbi:DUF6476 family protein [Falsirhodobacter xinxiangensis]|uniref:DUF6476 family protein n=1 Tax=Falsirhodobacter xinxiangensis TaxID=2530049 RepID=UPI0010AAE3CE|nr:DUF6476 family protein [Rhodobacter xinxiangensis]